jgi:hypothetical protein
MNNVGSFSIVGNEKYKKELAFCLYSIRALYSIPVLIYCDQQTKTYIRNFNFKNIYFEIADSDEKMAIIKEKVSGVKKYNNFHSPEYIYLKMDAMEQAIKAFGSTLFLDSDIVIVKDILEDIKECPVGLSPHHSQRNYRKSNMEYGIFNAGYVYASDEEVPKEWRNIFLHESRFYEQEGMWQLMRLFRFFVFDETHNVGFWRFKQAWKDREIIQSYLSGIKADKVKSWHFHIDPKTYSGAEEYLRIGYSKIYDEIINSLPYYLKMFLKDIIND